MEIIHTISLTPQVDKLPYKVRLPRKTKKQIIKVAGRDAYRDVIDKMVMIYRTFGYHKFKFTKK